VGCLGGSGSRTRRRIPAVAVSTCFFGTVTNPKNEKLHDLTPREVLTFVPLLIMAFWIGLYPKPFFQILEQPSISLWKMSAIRRLAEE